MIKSNSIGDLLYADVEALLRGEKPNESAAPLIVDIDAAAERARTDRAAAYRDEQRHRTAVEMKDSGKFPARIVAAALEPSLDTAAMRNAREYLQGRKSVICLAGGVGTGKSTAAAWIALESGTSAPGFIRASSLERRGRYSKSLDVWIESRSMLVIDDLGAEVLDGKGVFRSLLDEVIDTFYGRDARVVITTNLLMKREGSDDEPQFIERYGQRVASRLAEVGIWAGCGMRDLRRDQLKLATGGRA